MCTALTVKYLGYIPKLIFEPGCKHCQFCCEKGHFRSGHLYCLKWTLTELCHLTLIFWPQHMRLLPEHYSQIRKSTR